MTSPLEMEKSASAVLPEDAENALLIGRVWISGGNCGPSPVLVRDGNICDISQLAPTVAHLLNDPAKRAKLNGSDLPILCTVEEALKGQPGNYDQLHLLAPIDLQAIKACGVTFATSLLERVIEEAAGGDWSAAQEIRSKLTKRLGTDLSKIVPGSPSAAALKEELIHDGLWSQYMEVGLGPDAEVFTKSQPMSSVGYGDEIGLHPISAWSNPEPEIVLVVANNGEVVGAALGNDVNLRDVEGRSALLLGKAKDNNASCAIGPFIRMFDGNFTINDVRIAEISLRVDGKDGYCLEGGSNMCEISRDPLDLVAQTIGDNHQYPDGLVLFTGTLFSPIEDRNEPGMGFTHHMGDLVSISSPRLGLLQNTTTTSDKARPWTFGITHLFDNLCRRGLLR